MKRNTFSSRLLAAVLAIILCISLVGCSDISQIMDMADMMQGPDIETLGEGESIYSLSMFNDLPSDYSGADPLFWVAEGENGGKVYLLGSIHVADNKAYRIPEKIMNAFIDSDALAVECDIVAAESDITGQFKLMQYYMYTDGSKISDHVSPELYDAMMEFYKNNPSEQLTSLGYTEATLQSCKPSMWQSVFETIFVEKSGLDTNLGIDRHFLLLSKSMGKKVIEVESVNFQASMLDSFPDELNELLLSDYVNNDVDEYAQTYYDSYDAWLRGDAEFFYTEEEPDYSDTGMTAEEIAEYEALITQYYDALLHNRNVGMADAAENMLRKGQNVFYVVGAAHMGGSTGVITLLRQRGWKVTQLGGMNADPYTSAQGDTNTSTATTTTSTATTTTATTAQQSSTADGFVLSGNLDNYYEQYEALYQHFGGTTRPEKEETEKTTKTTKPTSSDNSSWNNWGQK